MPQDSNYRRAEKAFADGDVEEALQFCEKVEPKSADRLDAEALAVECLAELGRWEEADERAAMILKEDDEWPTGHLVRGLAAIENANSKEAEKHLKRAFALDATLGEAAIMLAALCDFRGAYDDADRWLKKAHKAEPDIEGPTRLTPADLDEILVAVVEDYPTQTARTLEESRFRVRPMPSAAELKRGVSLTQMALIEEIDPEGDPPTFAMTLFQRNLEREAADEEAVAEAIEAEIENALTVLAKKAAPKEPAKAKAAPAKRSRS
jgi:tetratricopeptide (TPR) repeat protein